MGLYLVLYCLTATQVPSKKSCVITYQGMQMITPLLNTSNQAAPQSKNTIPSLKVGDSNIITNKKLNFWEIYWIHTNPSKT